MASWMITLLFVGLTAPDYTMPAQHQDKPGQEAEKAAAATQEA